MCAWTQDTFCIKRKYKENEKPTNNTDHFKNIELRLMRWKTSQELRMLSRSLSVVIVVSVVSVY